jgi:hypothetical protein
MAHGTEQHLEHAEHAQHAAHDPFDRRVAVTMAITAAFLAGVTMLSHRGHNETLRLQTEANIHHTKASDKWGYYQAKNISSRQFQANLMAASFTAARSSPEAAQAQNAARKFWEKQVDKYEGDGYWAAQVATNFKGDKVKGGKKIKGGQLADLQAEAKDLEEKAHEREEKSHHVHENVNWLDFGHLGLELSLVLCSVAVLSKLRGFWFTGIAVALIGACLASVGVFNLYVAVPPH